MLKPSPGYSITARATAPVVFGAPVREVAGKGGESDV